jgi:hemerythrin-like metal-binding protein
MMSAENWNEMLRIGITEIDNEHRVVFQVVEGLKSSLQDAGRTHPSGTVASPSIPHLLDFIRKHFSAEEALMIQAAYPDFDDHKREHDLFLEYLEGARDRISATNSSSPALEVLNSASNWLHHHVEDVDRKLGLFLLEQSIRSKLPPGDAGHTAQA